MKIHDIGEFNSYHKKHSAVATTSTEDKTHSEIVVPCTLEDFFWGTEKNVTIERRVTRDNVCIVENKVLTVHIDAGALDGTSIFFRHEGDDGKDLQCVLKEQKHRLFERESARGSNLIHHVQMSLKQALTGTMVKVPTLSGRSILLACPEVVHPQYERLVKGEGMPNGVGDRNTRGDLIIRFHIQFPTQLNYTVKDCLRRTL